MTYYVYTDGACSNNGRKNAKAGIGVYFGEKDPRNISKKITGKQTNNRAELSAVIEAFYKIEPDLKDGKDITVVTDSNYVIKCVGSYGEKCFKNNWISNMKSGKVKKEIPNIDLLKKAYLLYKNSNIKFLHIKAHTGLQDAHSLGNEAADQLANIAIGVNQTKQEVNENKQKYEKKIYLTIAYKDKEHAKKLGARWDPKKKKWYAVSNNSNLDQLLLFS